jgi:hypothetical protein
MFWLSSFDSTENPDSRTICSSTAEFNSSQPSSSAEPAEPTRPFEEVFLKYLCEENDGQVYIGKDSKTYQELADKINKTGRNAKECTFKDVWHHIWWNWEYYGRKEPPVVGVTTLGEDKDKSLEGTYVPIYYRGKVETSEVKPRHKRTPMITSCSWFQFEHDALMFLVWKFPQWEMRKLKGRMKNPKGKFPY